MLGIMIQKMWHKKWMNLSLLLGCILLVATAVSFPIYQEAVYNRMLQDEFESSYTSTGIWPCKLNMMIQSKKDVGGGTISKLEALMPKLYTDLQVTERETIRYYVIGRRNIHSELGRNDVDDLMARLGAKTALEDHVEIVSGELYSESGRAEDGAIEVIVSEDCFVKMGYLLGETISFEGLPDENGDPVRMVIKGVYRPIHDDGAYWHEEEDEFDNVSLMRFDLFHDLFTGERAGKYTMNCYYTAVFNYDNILADDVDALRARTTYYTRESAYRSVIQDPQYIPVLDSYANKHARISATLVILQIPVLIMLAAFLLMISGQMYEMERNEISVIKSRGSSRGQIFRLYLYQGMVLTTLGAALGIPLGMFMARLLGATRNFLVFDLGEKLAVTFTKDAALYALAAVLLGLMCLTIPAIRHSGVSIVHLKQQKAMNKKRLWEKLYLDIICIAVAGYGYYNFHKSSGNMADAVLNGKSLDPLLYLSSSLMIIGLGLLFLRLQPILLKLLYTIGKRFWRPASFVSFMENVKNGRKQQLIMLFLMMTVSLGMYHSAVARTIVDNAVKNQDYLDGSDLILKEVWTEIVNEEGHRTGTFVEPDTGKYLKAPFLDSYTRVYNLADMEVSTPSNGKIFSTVMGIHTREYGNLTYVDKYLNGIHYYELLNELAGVEDGLLVSSNFRDKLGYKVGDSISFKNSLDQGTDGKIVGFFDYWPGYTRSAQVQQPDGSVSDEAQYLIVTHYERIYNKMGNVPYEIWAKQKDGTKAGDITTWIQENNVRLTKYVNRSEDLEATRTDPLLQGTNGVLTMGFVVTLLLCAVGYLIYWIMSLKERELVFGVLRASGFHKGELFHMLINEQIFCGILSILVGFGIGKITSVLFVPILQKAYASTGQVLPLQLITNETDLIRLIAVISGMMLLCLVVLTIMLLRMNVAKALKLGED